MFQTVLLSWSLQPFTSRLRCCLLRTAGPSRTDTVALLANPSPRGKKRPTIKAKETCYPRNRSCVARRANPIAAPPQSTTLRHQRGRPPEVRKRDLLYRQKRPTIRDLRARLCGISETYFKSSVGISISSRWTMNRPLPMFMESTTRSLVPGKMSTSASASSP